MKNQNQTKIWLPIAKTIKLEISIKKLPKYCILGIVSISSCVVLIDSALIDPFFSQAVRITEEDAKICKLKFLFFYKNITLGYHCCRNPARRIHLLTFETLTYEVARHLLVSMGSSVNQLHLPPTVKNI